MDFSEAVFSDMSRNLNHMNASCYVNTANSFFFFLFYEHTLLLPSFIMPNGPFPHSSSLQCFDSCFQSKSAASAFTLPVPRQPLLCGTMTSFPQLSCIRHEAIPTCASLGNKGRWAPSPAAVFLPHESIKPCRQVAFAKYPQLYYRSSWTEINWNNLAQTAACFVWSKWSIKMVQLSDLKIT